MKRVHFLGKTFLVRVAWVHFLKHDFVVLWVIKKRGIPIVRNVSLSMDDV